MMRAVCIHELPQWHDDDFEELQKQLKLPPGKIDRLKRIHESLVRGAKAGVQSPFVDMAALSP
jgi:hypothetical protein